MSPPLTSRATTLGTGLIGGSFALALRKYATDLHISGWDRPEILQQARSLSLLDESFTGDLAAALRAADLIYIALPIGVTLDLLPEIARLAPKHALVTAACSTKLRIAQSAGENFSPPATALFLGSHPIAVREVAGIAQADADLFRNAPYTLIADSSIPAESSPSVRDPRVSAFLKLLEKIGARPLWLGAQQHHYAAATFSHLPH